MFSHNASQKQEVSPSTIKSAKPVVREQAVVEAEVIKSLLQKIANSVTRRLIVTPPRAPTSLTQARACMIARTSCA